MYLAVLWKLIIGWGVLLLFAILILFAELPGYLKDLREGKVKPKQDIW